VLPLVKKIIICLIFAVLSFGAGFFTRGLLDRGRASGADEYYEGIQSELTRADESYSRLEEQIGSARSEVAESLELAGTIRAGADGIESRAVENTDLLGRAERILLDAGAREQSSQDLKQGIKVRGWNIIRRRRGVDRRSFNPAFVKALTAVRGKPITAYFIFWFNRRELWK
jgi:hypothetical protein